MVANTCSVWQTRQVALYQDAISTGPGQCWRWVYAVNTPAPEHPTRCTEPVAWMGFRSAFGRERVRFYACARHAEGLKDLRPVNRLCSHTRLTTSSAWP